MNKNCALKLVNEISLYYNARSKKHQNTIDYSGPTNTNVTFATYYFIYLPECCSKLNSVRIFCYLWLEHYYKRIE